MKALYKRVLSALMLCVIFISLFSCKASVITENPNQTTDADTTEAQISPIQPDTEQKSNYYDGADFVIASMSGHEHSDVFFEESLPTELDRQIKARNDALEEKLGIKITNEQRQNLSEYIKTLSKAESSPDLIYASGNGGMSELMLYGELAPLRDYRADSTTAVGVSVSVVQQLSVYGEIYMLTGAPIRSSIESANVIAYNTKALLSLGYEDGYLCQLVLDGEWTLDKMNSIAIEAKAINSVDSTYRAVSGNQSSLYSLWKGLGARTVEKASSDIPQIAVYSSKNVYLFEEVNNFALDVGGIPDSNNSLFYIGKISDAKSAFTSDFGVLPIPSYNEDAEYTCLLDFDSTFFTAMPTKASETEMSLDFLREFYACSVESVYPLYTDTKYFKNAEVLDIILKSRYFDFLDMYGIGHVVSSVFYSETNTADFDLLLKERAEFALDALEIVLGTTVGENSNKD